MKKCQTLKEISLGDNKTEREDYFSHKESQAFLNTKKLLIPIQNPLNPNNKIILTKKKKKQKNKNITNNLTNDNNTISNISLNSISNNDPNNIYKSKIYKKKRIPLPQKGSLSKEKQNYNSIGIKKKYVNIKKNLNISSSGINNEGENISKEIRSEEKHEKINYENENKCNLIPKISVKNNKKNIAMNNNYNVNKCKKNKKYLYLNHYLNSSNIDNNQKSSMSDRQSENQTKIINSNNYKKINKINKINNINNININLNNINNKIEYNDIVKNINSCRNDNNTKYNDINFLKKLNFDQPEKYHLLGFNTLIDNNSSSSKDLINKNNEINDSMNYNKNYIYKNNYTLNSNRDIKINENPNILNKKILYKLEPKIITPLILTPRNKPCKDMLKTSNNTSNSPEINNSKYKNRNINKIQKPKNTDNDNQKSYSIPYQINKNKINKKRIDLFEYPKQKSSNFINGENINRINIFVNDANDKNSHKSKNINININSNFNQNILTNESLTILNSSNSEISKINSNDITQIESEKDEKNNVLSSYQLNLYLNEAKKSNPKNININNISNKPVNRALLYISNVNKYHTDMNNNKTQNNTVDLMDIDNSLYQRNHKNANKIYDYNTRTYHPISKHLKLNNILFISINTNFKLLLIKFLDKKSLLVFSSLNKTFYKNFRKKIYKYFYEKIIKNNGNKDFIIKILNTIPRYASKILKENNLKNLKNRYEYYKKYKSIYNDIILQDITRTFPNDPSFKVDSINSKKLFNLLTSYSNYNKSIGYAQGLNFLAASSIFLFKNEEKVFIFLDGLINRFELKNLLSINNQTLPKRLKYFSHILNKYCTEFINYLNSKLLNHEFFSTSWLLTLFSNSMERNKLFICWSFMVIFGWKFFYSFVVELLLFYKKILLEIRETELSSKMKEILKGKQFLKDFNEIIKNTLNFMSNNIAL